MTTVYYRKVFSHLEEDAFFFLMEKIEAGRREKLLKLKGEGQRLRSLAAGCLLYEALCEKLGRSPKEQGAFMVSYGGRGKPYLPHHPDIHFNLSHSGEYVCCAVGEEPVGVDIQEHTSRGSGRGGAAACHKRLAERFFTPQDNERLAECREKEREELFFRMWSVKESYGKLTGLGIAGGLSGFFIDWEREAVLEPGRKEPAAYFARQDGLKGYSFCVCTRKRQQEICWKESSMPFKGTEG